MTRTALALLACAACTPPTAPPPVPDLGPRLDRIEARLLAASARRAAWEDLARRRKRVSAVACVELAEAATTREAR